MSTTSSLLEALEPRTLFSGGSAETLALNATVRADRLQVRVDLLKFRLDGLSDFITMQADRRKLNADHLAKDATLAPLYKTFNIDITHMRATLLGDRLNEATAVLKDELKIVTDLKHKLADKGNPTAEAEDVATLHADRIQLQTDMIAGLDARIATRQAAYTTLFNDTQAISAAIPGDTTASPTLVVDAQKWVTDENAHLSTMLADLQKIEADRTQLVADLTASQNS
jgi:hypothetical protein